MVDRRREFRRAAASFAPRLPGALTATLPSPPDIDDRRFERALDIHAAALAELLDRGGPKGATGSGDERPAGGRTSDDPLPRVLHHERRCWRATASFHQVPDPTVDQLEQVVAAATVYGGKDMGSTCRVLPALPCLNTNGADTVGRYRRWLQAIHPGPAILNPLRPDRLGKDLVAGVLADDRGRYGRSLRS
jgi:hypothetical protein